MKLEGKRKMSQMRIGDKAYINDTELSGRMYRRLMELGMIKGTQIECVMKSAHNDMSAFCVRGAIIALRKEDLEKIAVTTLENACTKSSVYA